MGPGGRTGTPNSNPNSLEGSSTVVEGGNNKATPTVSAAKSSAAGTPPSSPTNPPAGGAPEDNSQPPQHKLREFLHRVNIYLLAFIFVIVIGIVILVITLTASQKSNKQNSSTQNLTQSQLEQLAGTTETVGSSNQVLNIASNTIINGQVLVQKDLDVAGSIKVGGSLQLPGITVSGSSLFQQINTSKLSVSGDLTVGQTLNVAGAASFGGNVSIGSLTVQSLQLNGTLTLLHHITAGGSTPSHVSGSAVGNGGTTSLSGSDTGGSISINTGSSASAGCFLTVTFTQAFNATPHVIVTPIGSSAGGIAFYVTRTTTSFSVCTSSTPPSGSSFGFDYIVFD